MKMFKWYLVKVLVNKFNVRFSSLFINGARATENFAFVIPHIDYPERRKQKEIIQKQIEQRKVNIDLKKVEEVWSVYDEMKQRKTEYEQKKSEISRELEKLLKKSEPENQVIRKLKIQHDLLKENIKKLKVPLWSAEEAAILEVLKLPNSIHIQTPDKKMEVVYEHLDLPKCSKNHMLIGNELKLIDFKKNENYYLIGDAAVFELGAKFFMSNLLKRNNFIQFSNPDFVKSVIVEGCGVNHTDPGLTFILHHNEDEKINLDNRLHLTGGGSLFSFMAYHAKNVLYAKVLPLKYFSMGRQYIPSQSEEGSLFHVSQSSVVQVFGAASSPHAADQFVKELSEILKHAYRQFDCHFRIALVPADKLAMWESLRLVVEMYSSSVNRYIEVANVSMSGDFISKRLMFTYTENKEHKFPHVISGTILNVPRLLACLLEQDSDFVLPNIVKVENWKI